jgi:hypothetical protein
MDKQNLDLEWGGSTATGTEAPKTEATAYATYIDEVKYKPPDQRFFWLSAISLPSQSIPRIEGELSGLSERYFSTTLASRNTEFHAKNIFHGKGAFKGWDIGRRLALFFDLLQVLVLDEELARIEVKVNPEKMMRPEQKHEMAFTFMAERIEFLMRRRGGYTHLFHDKDSETDSVTAQLLSQFQRTGTPLAYGMRITRIMDTAHATDSCRSRLVQLADTYAFLMMLKEKTNPNYPARKILEHGKELGVLWPTKYKHWPS